MDKDTKCNTTLDEESKETTLLSESAQRLDVGPNTSPKSQILKLSDTDQIMSNESSTKTSQEMETKEATNTIDKLTTTFTDIEDELAEKTEDRANILSDTIPVGANSTTDMGIVSLDQSDMFSDCDRAREETQTLQKMVDVQSDELESKSCHGGKDVTNTDRDKFSYKQDHTELSQTEAHEEQSEHDKFGNEPESGELDFDGANVDETQLEVLQLGDSKYFKTTTDDQKQVSESVPYEISVCKQIHGKEIQGEHEHIDVESKGGRVDKTRENTETTGSTDTGFSITGDMKSIPPDMQEHNGSTGREVELSSYSVSADKESDKMLSQNLAEKDVEEEKSTQTDLITEAPFIGVPKASNGDCDEMTKIQISPKDIPTGGHSTKKLGLLELDQESAIHGDRDDVKVNMNPDPTLVDSLPELKMSDGPIDNGNRVDQFAVDGKVNNVEFKAEHYDEGQLENLGVLDDTSDKQDPQLEIQPCRSTYEHKDDTKETSCHEQNEENEEYTLNDPQSIEPPDTSEYNGDSFGKADQETGSTSEQKDVSILSDNESSEDKLPGEEIQGEHKHKDVKDKSERVDKTRENTETTGSTEGDSSKSGDMKSKPPGMQKQNVSTGREEELSSYSVSVDEGFDKMLSQNPDETDVDDGKSAQTDLITEALFIDVPAASSGDCEEMIKIQISPIDVPTNGHFSKKLDLLEPVEEDKIHSVTDDVKVNMDPDPILVDSPPEMKMSDGPKDDGNRVDRFWVNGKVKEMEFRGEHFDEGLFGNQGVLHDTSDRQDPQLEIQPGRITYEHKDDTKETSCHEQNEENEEYTLNDPQSIEPPDTSEYNGDSVGKADQETGSISEQKDVSRLSDNESSEDKLPGEEIQGEHKHKDVENKSERVDKTRENTETTGSTDTGFSKSGDMKSMPPGMQEQNGSTGREGELSSYSVSAEKESDKMLSQNPDETYVDNDKSTQTDLITEAPFIGVPEASSRDCDQMTKIQISPKDIPTDGHSTKELGLLEQVEEDKIHGVTDDVKVNTNPDPILVDSPPEVKMSDGPMDDGNRVDRFGVDGKVNETEFKGEHFDEGLLGNQGVHDDNTNRQDIQLEIQPGRITYEHKDDTKETSCHDQNEDTEENTLNDKQRIQPPDTSEHNGDSVGKADQETDSTSEQNDVSRLCDNESSEDKLPGEEIQGEHKHKDVKDKSERVDKTRENTETTGSTEGDSSKSGDMKSMPPGMQEQNGSTGREEELSSYSVSVDEGSDKMLSQNPDETDVDDDKSAQTDLITEAPFIDVPAASSGDCDEMIKIQISPIDVPTNGHSSKKLDLLEPVEEDKIHGVTYDVKVNMDPDPILVDSPPEVKMSDGPKDDGNRVDRFWVNGKVKEMEFRGEHFDEGLFGIQGVLHDTSDRQDIQLEIQPGRITYEHKDDTKETSCHEQNEENEEYTLNGPQSIEPPDTSEYNGDSVGKGDQETVSISEQKGVSRLSDNESSEDKLPGEEIQGEHKHKDVEGKSERVDKTRENTEATGSTETGFSKSGDMKSMPPGMQEQNGSTGREGELSSYSVSADKESDKMLSQIPDETFVDNDKSTQTDLITEAPFIGVPEASSGECDQMTKIQISPKDIPTDGHSTEELGLLEQVEEDKIHGVTDDVKVNTNPDPILVDSPPEVKMSDGPMDDGNRVDRFGVDGKVNETEFKGEHFDEGLLGNQGVHDDNTNRQDLQLEIQPGRITYEHKDDTKETSCHDQNEDTEENTLNDKQRIQPPDTSEHNGDSVGKADQETDSTSEQNDVSRLCDNESSEDKLPGEEIQGEHKHKDVKDKSERVDRKRENTESTGSTRGDSSKSGDMKSIPPGMQEQKVSTGREEELSSYSLSEDKESDKLLSQISAEPDVDDDNSTQTELLTEAPFIGVPDASIRDCDEMTKIQINPKEDLTDGHSSKELDLLELVEESATHAVTDDVNVNMNPEPNMAESSPEIKMSDDRMYHGDIVLRFRVDGKVNEMVCNGGHIDTRLFGNFGAHGDNAHIQDMQIEVLPVRITYEHKSDTKEKSFHQQIEENEGYALTDQQEIGITETSEHNGDSVGKAHQGTDSASEDQDVPRLSDNESSEHILQYKQPTNGSRQIIEEHISDTNSEALKVHALDLSESPNEPPIMQSKFQTVIGKDACIKEDSISGEANSTTDIWNLSLDQSDMPSNCSVITSDCSREETLTWKKMFDVQLVHLASTTGHGGKDMTKTDGDSFSYQKGHTEMSQEEANDEQGVHDNRCKNKPESGEFDSEGANLDEMQLGDLELGDSADFETKTDDQEHAQVLEGIPFGISVCKQIPGEETQGEDKYKDVRGKGGSRDRGRASTESTGPKYEGFSIGGDMKGMLQGIQEQKGSTDREEELSSYSLSHDKESDIMLTQNQAETDVDDDKATQTKFNLSLDIGETDVPLTGIPKARSGDFNEITNIQMSEKEVPTDGQAYTKMGLLELVEEEMIPRPTDDVNVNMNPELTLVDSSPEMKMSGDPMDDGDRFRVDGKVYEMECNGVHINEELLGNIGVHDDNPYKQDMQLEVQSKQLEDDAEALESEDISSNREQGLECDRISDGLSTIEISSNTLVMYSPAAFDQIDRTVQDSIDTSSTMVPDSIIEHGSESDSLSCDSDLDKGFLSTKAVEGYPVGVSHECSTKAELRQNADTKRESPDAEIQGGPRDSETEATFKITLTQKKTDTSNSNSMTFGHNVCEGNEYAVTSCQTPDIKIKEHITKKDEKGHKAGNLTKEYFDTEVHSENQPSYHQEAEIQRAKSEFTGMTMKDDAEHCAKAGLLTENVSPHRARNMEPEKWGRKSYCNTEYHVDICKRNEDSLRCNTMSALHTSLDLPDDIFRKRKRPNTYKRKRPTVIDVSSDTRDLVIKKTTATQTDDILYESKATQTEPPPLPYEKSDDF